MVSLDLAELRGRVSDVERTMLAGHPSRNITRNFDSNNSAASTARQLKAAGCALDFPPGAGHLA